MRPRLLVVDVDTGVDDGWALLAFLRAQRLGLVRILAVIAAAGNTDVDNVCINTCRVLQLAQAQDIPVYVGLIKVEETDVAKEKDQNETDDNFFGEDGFGDLRWDSEPDMTQVNPTDGLEALNHLTRENPGEITLVCLAPLTNIAEAIRLFPAIPSNLKEMFIMGGNYAGNQSEGKAEFNFLGDPESANAVLTKAKCPITLLPVDPCIDIDLTLPWRMEAFKNTTNPVIQMFNRIEEKVWKKLPDEKTWWECDLFLAAGIINGTVFKETITTNARVEVQGPRKGQVIIDDTKKHNVKIITKIDSSALKREVLASAEPIPIKQNKTELKSTGSG